MTVVIANRSQYSQIGCLSIVRKNRTGESTSEGNCSLYFSVYDSARVLHLVLSTAVPINITDIYISDIREKTRLLLNCFNAMFEDKVL